MHKNGEKLLLIFPKSKKQINLKQKILLVFLVATLLRLRHRGPDWTGIYCKGNNILCHERLAIVT
eukprot:UN01511